MGGSLRELVGLMPGGGGGVQKDQNQIKIRVQKDLLKKFLNPFPPEYDLAPPV